MRAVLSVVRHRTGNAGAESVVVAGSPCCAGSLAGSAYVRLLRQRNVASTEPLSSATRLAPQHYRM